MLTGDERKAVRLAGELYSHIAYRVCGAGPARDDDLAELRRAVHEIQHAIMAQAAARLYPAEFRLMGEAIGRAAGASEEHEEMTEIPDAAVRAAMAEHARLLIDRPDPMVLSDETLFRKVLEAALPHLAGPDLAAFPWRQGRRKGRNLYAVTGEDWEDHPDFGKLDTPELAEEAYRAHNEALDLRWLLGASHDVQIGVHDHSGGPAVYVRLLGDGAAALAEFHGCASPGEGLAKAREWSEREGLTP